MIYIHKQLEDITYVHMCKSTKLKSQIFAFVKTICFHKVQTNSWNPETAPTCFFVFFKLFLIFIMSEQDFWSNNTAV